MDDNLKLLLEEYKIGKDVIDGYFRNMYNTISFTIVTYGAVLALSSISSKEKRLMFLYFLPILTYILGLLYIYNLLVIMKHGNYTIRLEMLIKLRYYEKKKENCLFQGWDTFIKMYGRGGIISYGTVLAFYILLPVFDFLYGYGQLKINWVELFKGSLYDIIPNLVPIILYIIYIIFVIILIMNIRQQHHETKNISVEYKINGSLLTINPARKKVKK